MTARAPSAITFVASGLFLLRMFVPPAPMAPVPAPEASLLVSIGTPPAGQAIPSTRRDSHVRPMDPSASRLIDEGMRRSYTIARLVDAVEHSNVVVYLQVTQPAQGSPASQTHLVGSGPNGWRYASVSVDIRLVAAERLEMLGHELQHVVEIVEAPEVTDAGGLQRLYERIGYSNGREHVFETKRAILVALRVAQELHGTADSLTNGGGSPGAAAAEPRRLYDTYCAVCHGRDGSGHGPAHEFLNATPPDLTRLAQRHNGVFPRAVVEGCIRASARRASGATESDMPVWTTPPTAAHERGASVYAENIADYVESLQRRSQ